MGKRKFNEYVEQDGILYCVCGNGQKIAIDFEDYNRMKDHFWNFDKNGYVITHINRKEIRLTHFLFDPPHKSVIRFKTQDKFDYRKNNFYVGNTYRKYDDYYEGTTFDGQKFKIDAEDYPLISQYKWHVDSNGYLLTKINGKSIKMHRLILSLDDPSLEVDHIEHDQLDNRKSKLRIVNRTQNTQNTRVSTVNTSGVKGVYPQGDHWCAQINCDGKRYYLGYFANKEDAINARLKAEQELHKEFACNFIESSNRQSATKTRTE